MKVNDIFCASGCFTRSAPLPLKPLVPTEVEVKTRMSICDNLKRINASETFTRIDGWLPVDIKEQSLMDKMENYEVLLQLKYAAPA